jgi:DNA repair exonuclease SbcCD nuclease subunit
VKVLLIGDVHLADRPPSSCTETYLEDLFNLMDQASEVAKQYGCSAIIQAGDWFHIKMPSRNSHKLVIRSIDWASKVPCPVFVVPGNHDLSNDRLESLNEGQPLGAVIRSKAVKILDGWAEDFSIAAMPVYGVPWIQDWDASEDIADKAVSDALEFYRVDSENSIPFLVVTHAPFYPPGKEPKYENAEVYPPEKFALHMGGHGNVYYGHIHDPHGVYTVGGVRFANYGALSRGSLTESNLTRQVGVTVWDSITGEFEFVPLDARPASEVFRLQEIGEVKSAQSELDEFLASVGQTTVEITSTEAVMSHIKSLGLGKELEAIVEELLISAEGSTL